MLLSACPTPEGSTENEQFYLISFRRGRIVGDFRSYLKFPFLTISTLKIGVAEGSFTRHPTEEAAWWELGPLPSPAVWSLRLQMVHSSSPAVGAADRGTTRENRVGGSHGN